MEKIRNFASLDSFQLKIIAIVTMAIDHTGSILFPEELWMRCIGRLAFPIFCFLLVEGFLHTSNVKRYMFRLGIFALISEIPFDLAIYGSFFQIRHQNVFFTLFLGVVGLYLISRQSYKGTKLMIGLFMMLLAEILMTDYSSMGILLILCFYAFRDSILKKVLSVTAVNVFLMGYIQSIASLSLIPIACYNGERGRKIKYLFYLFYPVHLLILLVINIMR